MLVFILISSEENLVSFFCCCFAKVLQSHFTEFKDVLSVPVHFMTTPSFGKKWRLQYKNGKSGEADNILAELVQEGGEDAFTALTTICNKIWQTGEWPTP